ncbi:hypothetical protein GOODEAATRI_021358 [Goodea atripinnis]|uniref:Uncharacterized protein n=1 Tax=Goodea atripinnis TaxID=208336 RepID=A0ABV0PFT2_9TELE
MQENCISLSGYRYTPELKWHELGPCLSQSKRLVDTEGYVCFVSQNINDLKYQNITLKTLQYRDFVTGLKADSKSTTDMPVCMLSEVDYCGSCSQHVSSRWRQRL